MAHDRVEVGRCAGLWMAALLLIVSRCALLWDVAGAADAPDPAIADADNPFVVRGDSDDSPPRPPEDGREKLDEAAWDRMPLAELVERLHAEVNPALSPAMLEIARRGPAAVETMPTLIELLEDEHLGSYGSWLIADAVVAVAGDRIEEHFDGLRGRLRSDDPWERRKAAIVLGNLWGAHTYRWEGHSYRLQDETAAARAVAGLAESLSDRQPEVRREAARALGKITEWRSETELGREAKAALWDALEDMHPSVRGAAIHSLGLSLTIVEAPRMFPLAEDSSAAVRQQVANALGAAAWRMTIPREEWFEDEQVRRDPALRQKLEELKATTDRHAPRLRDVLVRLARDEESRVRASALAGLNADWGSHGEPVRSTLRAALAGGWEDERRAAAGGLTRFGKQVTPDLVAALGDEDELVQWAVVEGLGSIHDAGTRADWPELLFKTSKVQPGILGEPPVRRAGVAADAGSATAPIDEMTRLAAAALAKKFAETDADLLYRRELGQALIAIGPGGAGSAATVARALDCEDSVVDALKILNAMGTGAQAESPKIAAILRREYEREFDYDLCEGPRIGAVVAIRKIGWKAADAEVVMDALIETMGDEEASIAHHAALAMARGGKSSVPRLLETLSDENPRRRRSAAFALAHIPEHAAPAEARLAELLDDPSDDVVWNATQALGQMDLPADRMVPRLVRVLRKFSVRRLAVDLLERFGPDAQEAVPELVKLLPDTHDESLQHAMLRVLAALSIDAETAATLADMRLTEQPRIAAQVLVVLKAHPERLQQFLQNHPGALAEASSDVLQKLLETDEPALEPIREAILGRDDLPAGVMAWTMDPRFLPIIRERMEQADPHHRTYLAACARACGEPPDRVVEISAARPGDFRPPSAFADPRRMPTDFRSGHGDGATPVCVTGRILMDDGRPAAVPRFFEANDRMLLGWRRKDPARIKYDPETGRFVFLTHVFAAYAISRTAAMEKGPYQTGPARVIIEAQGAEPLEVTFFDEMPDVLITLRRTAENRQSHIPFGGHIRP